MFVGERDSLITKCPSKYKTAPPQREPELLMGAASPGAAQAGAKGSGSHAERPGAAG